MSDEFKAIICATWKLCVFAAVLSVWLWGMFSLPQPYGFMVAVFPLLAAVWYACYLSCLQDISIKRRRNE